MAKTWFKKRHLIIKRIVSNYLHRKYRKKYDLTFDKIDLTKPSLLLCNHQSVIDQFIISIATNCDGYFVISDDFLNRGLVSKLLDFSIKPIPYKKGSVDFNFFRICKKIINENQSIIIFPEGNRTYSGKTGYINPTITKMVKFLKVPIILSVIEGGYSAYPRYAGKSFKGKINYKFVKRIEPDVYLKLSDEELLKIIVDGLKVDETITKIPYYSIKKAEYLDRVLYYCPNCGLTSFYSEGKSFHCVKCQKPYTIDEYGKINCDIDNVGKWYDYQISMLKPLLNKSSDDCLFTENIHLTDIISRYKKKCLFKNGIIKLYSDRLVLNNNKITISIDLKDIISSGCFGANKFNIFLKDRTYQIYYNERFNALKYVHFIYLYKQKEGLINDGFMGI